VARAKGRLRVKQPKLNPRQEAHLVALLKSGEYSTAEIGDLFGVARSTVYRAIGRGQRQGTSPTIRRRPEALNWLSLAGVPEQQARCIDIPMAGGCPAGSPAMRDVASIVAGRLLISVAGWPNGRPPMTASARSPRVINAAVRLGLVFGGDRR
jgi:hypothetical protein